MSKVTAIKRESYFTRVRKRWKRRDVLEIDEEHPKYLFTQYIRCGLRIFLLKQGKLKSMLEDKDYTEIASDEIQWEKNNAHVLLHSYAPEVFGILRLKAGLTAEEYIDIISPALEDVHYLEFLSNSKSGQSFFFTNNKQYMIKTITKQEADFFIKILSKYADHFNCFPHSLLVKFCGLHSIKLRKLQKPVYFVVMLSIFYPGERIQQRYDIKACQIGRFTKPAPEGSNVVVILKEKNWKDKKLALGQQREWFLKQIKHDTTFLKEIGVLDYSLLIGIQPLHLDEIATDKKLATLFTRVQKSVSSKQSVTQRPQQAPSLQGTSFAQSSCSQTTSDKVVDFSSLPGMIDAENDSVITTKSKKCLEEETGEEHFCPVYTQASTSNGSSSGSNGILPNTVRPNGTHSTSNVKTTCATSSNIYCPFSPVSAEDSIRQNRRLLPNYRNELHVLDGEERYYLGVIDFFTRYTLKKRLENAYKRILYKPLTFSTVHPDIFAARFCKYWEDHTE